MFNNKKVLSLIKSNKQKHNKMENKVIKWRVQVNRKGDTIIVEAPFFSVNNAHEFISERIGKRVVSIERL